MLWRATRAECVAIGLRAGAVVAALGVLAIALPAVVARNPGYLLGFPHSPFWVAVPVVVVVALGGTTGVICLTIARSVEVSATWLRVRRWDRTELTLERRTLLRPVFSWRWLGAGFARFRARRPPVASVLLTARQLRSLRSLPEYGSLPMYDDLFTRWGTHRRPSDPRGRGR